MIQFVFCLHQVKFKFKFISKQLSSAFSLLLFTIMSSSKNVRNGDNNIRGQYQIYDLKLKPTYIPELKPNWLVVQNSFRNYMDFLITHRYHQFGGLKLTIEGFNTNQDLSFDFKQMKEKVTPHRQFFVESQDGVFQLLNILQTECSVVDFYKNSLESEAPMRVESEDFFWKNLTQFSNLYGLDCLAYPLNHIDGLTWDLRQLDPFLKDCTDSVYESLEGVTSPYTYLGNSFSAFASHREDSNLCSLNYLLAGGNKVWYFIAPSSTQRYLQLMKVLFPKSFYECRSFLQHKTVLVSPLFLKSAGIQVNKVVQTSGDFIVAFSGVYHFGYNEAPNISTSVNFSHDTFITFMRSAEYCHCKTAELCPIVPLQPYYDNYRLRSKYDEDQDPHPWFGKVIFATEQPFFNKSNYEMSPELNVKNLLNKYDKKSSYHILIKDLYTEDGKNGHIWSEKSVGLFNQNYPPPLYTELNFENQATFAKSWCINHDQKLYHHLAELPIYREEEVVKLKMLMNKDIQYQKDWCVSCSRCLLDNNADAQVSVQISTDLTFLNHDNITSIEDTNNQHSLTDGSAPIDIKRTSSKRKLASVIEDKPFEIIDGFKVCVEGMHVIPNNSIEILRVPDKDSASSSYGRDNFGLLTFDGKTVVNWILQSKCYSRMFYCGICYSKYRNKSRFTVLDHIKRMHQYNM